MPPERVVVSVVGACLVNVSAYGMMIESPAPLEIDAVLQFRLIVAGEKADIEARVAVCAPRREGKRRIFGVGLEFVRIPAGDQERLTRVLARPVPARAD